MNKLNVDELLQQVEDEKDRVIEIAADMYCSRSIQSYATVKAYLMALRGLRAQLIEVKVAQDQSPVVCVPRSQK